MSALRPVLKSGPVMNFVRRSYHAPSDFKHVTLGDLPVPTGSWQSHYDAKNSKYNMHLIAGVATLVITIATAKMSGLVYLNYSAPSRPN